MVSSVLLYSSFTNIYVSMFNYIAYLILYIGQEFACSGIAIKRVGDVTRFLTSANLARALIDDKRLDHDNVKVGAANNPILLFHFT